MNIDDHVFDRMLVRLTEEEQKQVIEAIRAKWNRLQNNCRRSFAIVAMDLKTIRMTDDSGWDSNGSAVVGIVRQGTLRTVMLRRFNQPMTKDALRVNVVKWAIKPPFTPRKRNRRRNWR